MATLNVDSAKINYNILGSGQVLILVPGGNGNAGVFSELARHLSTHYKVVTFDRRGFSRSTLDSKYTTVNCLQDDADDIRRLIEHLSDEPAIVFGSSSGGVVALEVMTHHPSVVQTLVVHEPAAVKQLPDGQAWVDFFAQMYDLYRQSGLDKPHKEFVRRTFAVIDQEAIEKVLDFNDPEIATNASYWFEKELRQYTSVDLDINKLKENSARIVLLGGRESQGYPTYRVNLELSKKLDRNLTEMPGGHIGYAMYPEAFARDLLKVLAKAPRTL